LADVRGFSQDEIEAVRDYANRLYLPERPKWLVRLIQFQLRDGSRKNFNQRGKKIEAMLVGSRDRNARDLPLGLGEHRREEKIPPDQELLDLRLAWITEHGFVHLNARGRMLSNEAYLESADA
jgi:hypothetical protein